MNPVHSTVEAAVETAIISDIDRVRVARFKGYCMLIRVDRITT
jgi:hypothetical protein